MSISTKWTPMLVSNGIHMSSSKYLALNIKWRANKSQQLNIKIIKEINQVTNSININDKNSIKFHNEFYTWNKN